MKRDVLQQTLWGDFYFNAKTKSISRTDQSGSLRPMFSQFILDNIWAVYNAFLENPEYVLFE